jgi:pyruvate dehydrogenase E1 component beta subunit
MEVPEGDFVVPLGTVAVRRQGSDVAILANMLMVHRALAAAEQLAGLGIEAEVIDLRCLVPIDMATIARSVAKTHRVLIVEEDNRTGGWGAEIAAEISEKLFDELDAPVTRLAASDTPLPCAPALERASIPGVDAIARACRQLVEGDP